MSSFGATLPTVSSCSYFSTLKVATQVLTSPKCSKCPNYLATLSTLHLNLNKSKKQLLLSMNWRLRGFLMISKTTSYTLGYGDWWKTYRFCTEANRCTIENNFKYSRSCINSYCVAWIPIPKLGQPWIMFYKNFSNWWTNKIKGVLISMNMLMFSNLILQHKNWTSNLLTHSNSHSKTQILLNSHI